ncbi:Endopeptidase Clp protein [Dioscorea alata]|uniref:Endopeptidase Clp protein n=1 Tax=Dioscorea alata TaxID=55571 RepID=A0ACB7UZY2_DIOAL|nr:Endopeptidase Clp protein [Dioscorea alata]
MSAFICKRYGLFNSGVMIQQPIISFQVANSDVMMKEKLHHKVSLNGYFAITLGKIWKRSMKTLKGIPS